LEQNEPAEALTFGLAIHAALQNMYDLTGNPHEVFETIYRDKGGYQWGFLGGEVPQADDVLELGHCMIGGYEFYRRRGDRGLRVMATETNWTTVIEGIDVGGRYDLIVEDEAGMLWVLDFKTTSSTAPEWAADSVQGAVYVSAARRLYGDQVGGIIFRFLRKKQPDTWSHGLILKSGKLTEKESLCDSTTYREYLTAIAVVAAQQIHKCTPEVAYTHLYDKQSLAEWKDSEEWKQFQAYYQLGQSMHAERLEMLEHSDSFYWDVRVPVSAEQAQRNEKLLLVPALRAMIANPKIIPSGLGSAWALCRRCQFRGPCEALRFDGDDTFRDILRTQYHPREVANETE
jgi:hypothetical protein